MNGGSGRKRPTSAQQGYGYRWQQARAAYLRENPLCVMCREKGHVTAANVVDHKIPHKGDQVLFWDRENWQSLCKPHHDSDKRRIDQGGAPKPTIGLDGWPK